MQTLSAVAPNLALPQVASQIGERIKQEAPTKTPPNSSLRGLSRVSINLQFGVCHLVISDQKDPSKERTIYRRLAAEHFEKLKKMHEEKLTTDAPAAFVQQIVDKFIAVRPHFQAMLAMKPDVVDEIQASMKSPDEEQQQLLTKYKIFDFAPVDSLNNLSTPVKTCIFTESYPQEENIQQFKTTFGPCNQALTDLALEALSHKLLCEGEKVDETVMVGSVPTSTLARFKLLYTAKNERMRALIEKQDPLLKQILEVFLKPQLPLSSQ